MRNVLLGVVLLVVLLINSVETIPQLFFEQEEKQDIHFTFAYDEVYAEKLRSQYSLKEIVSDRATNLEKILKITDWVHHLWEHNGDAVPAQSDPLSILKEVFEEKKQFRCVEYAIVLNGCLNALGIQSRVVGLTTADVETREYGAGHVVTESYLPDLDKWIMIDCQANVVPVVNDIPLNAVELQQALAQKDYVSFVSWNACLSQDDAQSYIQFIEQYLYYFRTRLVHSYTPNKDAHSLMLVPTGVQKPTIFQRLHPLINVHYTHSAEYFYQKPKRLFVKSNFSAIKIELMQKQYIDAVKEIIKACIFELQIIPSSSIEQVEEEIEKAKTLDDIDNFQAAYIDNGGTFLVLLDEDKVVGVGAFRRIDSEICEGRRMFFKKEYRGRGLGRFMANKLAEKMQEHGYKKVRLEVFNVKTQRAAIGLYKKLGFYEIPHYRVSAAQLSMEKQF